MQENQVDLQLQIECVLRLPPVPVLDPVSRCGSRKRGPVPGGLSGLLGSLHGLANTVCMPHDTDCAGAGVEFGLEHASICSLKESMV